MMKGNKLIRLIIQMLADEDDSSRNGDLISNWGGSILRGTDMSIISFIRKRGFGGKFEFFYLT